MHCSPLKQVFTTWTWRYFASVTSVHMFQPPRRETLQNNGVMQQYNLSKYGRHGGAETSNVEWIWSSNKSAGKNTLFKSHENLQVEWWSCRTLANWAKFCYFHETLEDWLLWCFALSCLAFSSSSTLFLDAMKPFALFNTCASKPQKQWLLFVEPLQFVSEIIFLEHLQVASCFLPKMMWLAPVLDGW